MYVSVMDANQSGLNHAHQLRFLRRVACISLATLILTTGVIWAGYAGTQLVRAAQSSSDNSAVALEAYDPFVTSDDASQNALISYFQSQQNTSVNSVTQPFHTSSATLGAGQALSIRNQSKAQLIGGFQDRSGVKVNLYQSTLGTPLHLTINQDAIATMLDFAIDHMGQANNAYLSQPEISRLQSRAQAGKLDYVTLNIIIAASPKVCNDQLIPRSYTNTVWKDDKTCDSAGTYFPLNLSGGPVPVEQTLSLSLFDNKEVYSSDLNQKMALNKKATVSLVHELSHAVTDLSGARQRYLGNGVKEADLDNREHKLFVDPMEDLMKQATANILSTGIDENGQTTAVSMPRLPFRNLPLKLYK